MLVPCDPPPPPYHALKSEYCITVSIQNFYLREKFKDSIGHKHSNGMLIIFSPSIRVYWYVPTLVTKSQKEETSCQLPFKGILE